MFVFFSTIGNEEMSFYRIFSTWLSVKHHIFPMMHKSPIMNSWLVRSSIVLIFHPHLLHTIQTGCTLCVCEWQGLIQSVLFSLSGELSNSVNADPYKVTRVNFPQYTFTIILCTALFNGVLMPGLVLCLLSLQYNYNSGINYETLGPDELRSLLTTVSSFHVSIIASIHHIGAFWSSQAEISLGCMTRLSLTALNPISTAMWGDLGAY